MGLRQLARDEHHLRLRVSERPTGFQPADEIHLSGRTVRQRGIGERRPIGNKDVGGPPGTGTIEASRRDADDRIRHVVKHEPCTDNARVSGEAFLPERVTQDHDQVASRGGVFACEKKAPLMRSEAQHTEVAWRNDDGQKLLAALGVGQHGDVAVAGQLAENGRVVAKIEVVGV
jgi:hypothetical protein